MGLLIMLASGYTACAALFPWETWRYKITISIDTPEGLRSGYAVREIRASTGLQWSPEMSVVRADVLGEAAIINLDKGLKIFALTSSYDYQIFFDAFKGPPGLTKEGIKFYSALKNKKATLPLEQYPQLVFFKDIRDPDTVSEFQWVQTGKNSDDAIRIREITIETTNEPITQGIELILPWLKDKKKGYLDGSRTSHSVKLSNILHYGNFKSGD